MLQIRLRKPSVEGGGSKSLPPDAVTVACPDHLALSDLPVAKNLGSPSTSALVKIVGRRSRRQLGERVHFCVDCDLPIAVYGRLSPCDHVFCLDCARSGSFCFICEERIQKIQTIKMMEGILICAAPRCLKSFLKKSDFETHILETHADLLHPTAEIEGNDSEVASARKPSGSDSTVQAPPRPLFSGHPSSQVHDREAHRPQFRDQPTPRPVMPPKPMPGFPGQIHNHSSEQLLDNNAPPGFDRLGSQNRFAQQAFDSQGSMHHEPGQLPDKQQGIRVESPFPEYPFPRPLQHPNYALPVMMNAGLAAPQFGYPHFMPDGAQPVFGTPYEMARPESAPEAGSEQGLLSGFPPGPPPVGGNFGDGYTRPWSLGPAVGTFEQSPSGQGTMEGFMTNAPDPGRPAIFHGDYGRSPGPLPSNLPPPPPVNKGVEIAQSGTSIGPRDNKGILAPPSLPLPPPPPFPPHLAQLKRGKFYSDETNTDGQGFGWPNDRRDSFGSNQD